MNPPLVIGGATRHALTVRSPTPHRQEPPSSIPPQGGHDSGFLSEAALGREGGGGGERGRGREKTSGKQRRR